MNKQNKKSSSRQNKELSNNIQKEKLKSLLEKKQKRLKTSNKAKNTEEPKNEEKFDIRKEIPIKIFEDQKLNSSLGDIGIIQI